MAGKRGRGIQPKESIEEFAHSFGECEPTLRERLEERKLQLQKAHQDKMRTINSMIAELEASDAEEIMKKGERTLRDMY